MPDGITAAEITDGRHLRKSSPLAILPSWLLSLCLHATLLYIFATQLPASWGPGSTTGGDEGGFRDVGIYVKGTESGGGSGGEASVANAEPDPNQPDIESMPNAVTAPEANPLDIPRANDALVSDRPPVNLAIPSVPHPVLGPGVGLGDTPPSVVRDALAGQRRLGTGNNGGTLGPSGGSGRGPGDGTGVVPFLGIGDRGTKFVYVIDCSGSMAFNSAIRVAKDELMTSLETLERTQQFQIIFYNTVPRPLSLSGEAKGEMYWATSVNRTRARQFIANAQPEQGTDHMPALRMALRMQPEVIFFLTDADQPQLTSAELDEIRRINGTKSRIHCIRFGQGADLEPTNFLRKLAEQNGGRYRYRDVLAFQKLGAEQ